MNSWIRWIISRAYWERNKDDGDYDDDVENNEDIATEQFEKDRERQNEDEIPEPVVEGADWHGSATRVLIERLGYKNVGNRSKADAEADDEEEDAEKSEDAADLNVAKADEGCQEEEVDGHQRHGGDEDAFAAYFVD